MFKISDLGLRDTVNLVDGAKLGPVKDVHIDMETGKVLSLVLSGGRKYFGLLSAGKDVEVPWEKIKKIGKHTVLLELD
ncbi:MAG: YlmC/YmxH family sporulation protein [Desulfotomaculaceae bacterium]|nr:YlmC/YmxH family sporulation protein [Desulfotomaculaceae bacterium]